MTHAADQSEHEKDPGLAGLVLILPLLILQFIFARFAQRLDRLKAFRRTRPRLKNWRDHFDRLRQCEWHILQLRANGACQVLAFGDVDLNFIPMIVDVPDDLPWTEPSSPAALHVRMQGIARFHADPERYIRRHAERIRRRGHEAEGGIHLPPTTSTGLARRSSSAETAPAGYTSAWTLGIPAPP